MTPFTLILLTPDLPPVQYEILTLAVDGTEGALGILAGHQDAVIQIEGPTITWTPADASTSVTARVTGAVLRMEAGVATVYAEALRI